VPTSLRAVILLAACVCSASLMSCDSSPAPSPAPTASRAALPPAWVQQEVSWQALALGDPHPEECRWALVRTSRAASLDGRNTSYLKTMYRRSREKVFVAVVHGDFRDGGGKPHRAGTLYLVLSARGHSYLAHGLVTGSPDLTRLGGLHEYMPQPAPAEVWGHTMIEGGPFPGGPTALADVPVAVWAGRRAAGEPLDMLRSDINGFFKLDLPPGTYVFRLQDRRHGFQIPQVVVVREGQPVAAPVVGGML
jgi:hypothetical protein